MAGAGGRADAYLRRRALAGVAAAGGALGLVGGGGGGEQASGGGWPGAWGRLGVLEGLAAAKRAAGPYQAERAAWLAELGLT